ncbi:MAG: spore germination protein, partial [Firmicutes bacterium]|nr:spore germination protein [Bacillota bacterium]
MGGDSVDRGRRRVDRRSVVAHDAQIWTIPDGSAPLSTSLDTNLQRVTEVLAQAADLVVQAVPSGSDDQAAVVYFSDMVDVPRLEQVLAHACDRASAAAAQVAYAATLQELVEGIVRGQVALLRDRSCGAQLYVMPTIAARSIAEPGGETVIRGPREGLVESLHTNVGLLRKRLRTHRLQLEQVTLGVGSQSDVMIAYIAGIASSSVINELRARLARVSLDAVIDSLYIEECIEDCWYSPFPQIQNTERPDVVAAALLRGRVALLVDGSPHALIVPMTLWYGLESAQDDYERWLFMTAVRWLRFMLLAISLALTPYYIALITFHPQIIPSNLLFSISAAREPNPFPTLVEALIAELVFEGLREAGIRLPQHVGAAVSIVGGVVVGQAAVEAGLLSAPLVIVVSLAGIASFSVAQYNVGFSFRVLRFGLLLLAGTLGLYGLTIGLLAIANHLIHLRSFGVPYLRPIAPNRWRAAWREVVIR